MLNRMGILFFLSSLLVATQVIAKSDFTPVCQRTAQVRDELVRQTKKECRSIVENDLSQIEILDLVGKKVGELKASDLSGLSGLKAFDLGRNNLKTLPEGIFLHTPKLTGIYVVENQIEKYPPGLLSKLAFLEDFHSAYNQITELPEGFFSDTKSLKSVGLHHNRLTKLPTGLFADLPALELVHLDVNEIVTLPEDLLKGAKKLEEVTFTGNRILKLPKGLFGDLAAIKVIQFDWNKISALSDDFYSDLAKVRHVTFINNPRLTEEAITRLKSTFGNRVIISLED